MKVSELLAVLQQEAHIASRYGRDPEVVSLYDSDVGVYSGKISIRWAWVRDDGEIVDTLRKSNAGSTPTTLTPVLVVEGTNPVVRDVAMDEELV